MQYLFLRQERMGSHPVVAYRRRGEICAMFLVIQGLREYRNGARLIVSIDVREKL
jgi:hypothetical protein